MLKSCISPTLYANYSNTTCGEIICQTETVFIIVCKLCDIKIFDYNEFINHFQNIHWAQISCDSKLLRNKQTGTENDSSTSKKELKDIINTEQTTDTLKKQFNKSNVKQSPNSNSLNNVDAYADNSLKTLTKLKETFRTTLDSPKEKRFECLQCNRKFSTNHYLRFHTRQQHETKKFKCEKCSKSFADKRYLTLHQRSHKGYNCEMCNKVFDKYEALRYHRESHIQTKNFVCDYENCGKAFPNNRRLSVHKHTHFAQPSFVCEICGSRQRSNEFLVVHIRTHTGEKPYACKKCDRRFASKHFLQDHQSVHATERSHVCSVCSKTFASSKSLYHHRHLHSGIKKYVCKICSSAYSQAAGLSAHMRKHKRHSILDAEDDVRQ